ncbi:TPM domain-containing protein [Tenacibaculum maritimum]|nr:TPM domain-containing protein [Tenacibaculum maritimum]MDB0600383.1 TPM domain-containing protein [Tenacibaculum maritimum]MDB0610538.1 TPM domain-containing protein [Tenacibaculum maritimum]
MSKVEGFLSVTEEQEIVAAIQIAEQNTSGEIRVHIEATTNKPHYERALEVFSLLKMFETKQRNGVLIYIAVKDHKFVVYGDQGIHKVVAADFWDATKNTMQKHFKKGKYKEGLVAGILKAGNALKKYFPWTIADENELTNEISKG